MSITTYAELQTAVASWLHRTDLTDIIPDFITLAESRINCDLQVNVKETEATLVTVAGQAYAALPSDFVSPISLKWRPSTDSIQQELPHVLPEQLQVSTSQTSPQMWAIDGATVSFGEPLDQAYTVILRYMGSLTLSTTATTNWLLTNHPDAYLWGTLLEAAIYAQDSDNINLYGSKFENSMKYVKRKENRSRDVPLRMDAGLYSARSGNIIDGW